jgi:hypothetical protein
MKVYEIETDDIGLGFMDAHEKLDIEVIKEYETDTMQKFYRVKVKDKTDGIDEL